MDKKPPDLLDRTRAFAKRALKLSLSIPAGAETSILKRQLVRAATSVGANYRAARRSRSKREFLSRLAIVEEEADECVYWLDLLLSLDTPRKPELDQLRREAGELVAIAVASSKTAKRKAKRS